MDIDEWYKIPKTQRDEILHKKHKVCAIWCFIVFLMVLLVIILTLGYQNLVFLPLMFVILIPMSIAIHYGTYGTFD